MRPDLEHWLGQYYKARVLKVGAPSEMEKVISQRLEADQGLMQAAREEKNRIEALATLCGGYAQLRDRCHVSAIHLEMLSKVIPT